VGAAAEVRHELRLRRRLRPDDGLHLRVVDQVHRCNEKKQSEQSFRPICSFGLFLHSGPLETIFFLTSSNQS
jgi:hypothetical protein